MVGRQIDELYPTPSREKGDVVLELNGLTRRGYFEDISFSLRRGEILGFAGLVGAGRTELAEAMFGVHPAESGTMALEGLPYIARSPARPSGAAWRTSPKTGWRTACVTGDAGTAQPNHARLGPDRREARPVSVEADAPDSFGAGALVSQLQAGRLDQLTSSLSGGNQQKVVLGKWLATEPTVLILDEPTHGIDVGTKSEVLAIVADLARSGSRRYLYFVRARGGASDGHTFAGNARREDRRRVRDAR